MGNQREDESLFFLLCFKRMKKGMNMQHGNLNYE